MTHLLCSDIKNCLKLGVSLPFDRNGCILSPYYKTVFIVQFLSINSLQGCFSLYLKYENQCFMTNSFKSILFLFYPLLTGIYSLLLGVLVFIYCKMDCEAQNHDGCFLIWRRFCSFNWFTVWLLKLLHFTGHL